MIIKNGTIFDENGSRVVDILIEDTKIKKIAPKIDETNHEMIDAKGMYLLPGIVDLNVRVRDDKLNPKNLDSLSQKAIRSGVTTFVLNSYDGLESGTTIDLLNAMLKNLTPDILLSISGVNSQNRLNDISILINNGAKVIKDHSDINSNLIRRLMEYANLKQTPMFWFCEDNSINAIACMNDGEVSSALGLPGNLKIGEISEVAKIVEFAKFYKSEVILQTLSTPEAITLAKKEKLPNISTEVAIHNLILDETSCKKFNTYAKLRPPLRDSFDKETLLKLLKDGLIDTITASHSPKSILYKDVAFEEAMFGVDSLELFLPLCYTHLVKSNLITVDKLQTLISKNPAQLMKLHNVGKIEEDLEADLIIFDPNYEFEVQNRYSPYHKMRLFGKIQTTIKRAKVISSQKLSY